MMVRLISAVFAQQPLAALPPESSRKRPPSSSRSKSLQKSSRRVLERATPENISIYISLGKQARVFLVGEEIAVDTPISSENARD